MLDIHATAERFIPVPAAQVYAYIADHRRHHPNFLPPEFTYYEVEEGGVGAGTVVRYRLALGGRENTYRARIDEPRPGRVITETIEGTGMVTTFEIHPELHGCQVSITTEWQRSGVRGIFERVFAPPMLRRVFMDELARLETYAREQSAALAV